MTTTKLFLVAAVVVCVAAGVSARANGQPARQPTTAERSVSWWWVVPPSNNVSDPGVTGLLSFAAAHHDIMTTVIMRCGVMTCCRAGSPGCGGTYNKTAPRCTNNDGIGGTIVGEVSPVCKHVIPRLAALGIRSELWLGEDDSLSSARYLFAHPNETATALLSVARSTPGIEGFNLDLETGLGNGTDVEAYTTFLRSVSYALSASRLRFSTDVSCAHNQTGGWAPPLLSNCSALARSGVGRLMNMRTYNAPSFEGWYYNALVPALAGTPLDTLGIGLGCWIDSRTNNTWNVRPQSASDRVCMLMNRSVQEIDMFVLRQGETDPLRNFPEPFWIPHLEAFVAGGGCSIEPPALPRCPRASVGPANAWSPGDPGCCESSSNRGPHAECNVTCAQGECAAAHMHWRPENYTTHPFECCNTTRPEAVLANPNYDNDAWTSLFWNKHRWGMQ